VEAGFSQLSFDSIYTRPSSHKVNSEYKPLLSGSTQLYPMNEFFRYAVEILGKNILSSSIT
jgi:hypothetical protein